MVGRRVGAAIRNVPGDQLFRLRAGSVAIHLRAALSIAVRCKLLLLEPGPSERET
jgi:hypothetical protein